MSYGWPVPDGDPTRSQYIVGDRTNVFVLMAASYAVAKAIKLGQLQRLPCWVCGNEKVQAHHPCYAEDMWLDVVWLCPPHHRQLHQEAKQC